MNSDHYFNDVYNYEHCIIEDELCFLFMLQVVNLLVSVQIFV